MLNYKKIKLRTYEIIEKAEEGDKVSKWVDWMLLILILLNTLAIILESFNGLMIEFRNVFRWFEILSVAIFTVEYFVRLWTSDIAYSQEKNKFSSLLKYMFSFMALVDLFAILPFYLPMVISIDLRFLRMFRLSRVFRILKINRYTKALSHISHVIKDKKDELSATIFILVFLVLVSATVMYYVESEVQPDAYPNIIASFWWAIATLTTVGYGDVYPITVIGKIFASIISVLGIGLVALPTGIISSGFIESLGKKKDVPCSESNGDSSVCPHCGKRLDEAEEK